MPVLQWGASCLDETGRGRLLPASLMFTEGAFVCRFLWMPDEIPLLDKATLGSLGVFRLLAVMGLVGVVVLDQTHRLWKTWPVRARVLCGQNSRVVFCSGSVAVVLFESLLLRERHVLGRRVVANMAVWGGRVLAAMA